MTGSGEASQRAEKHDGERERMKPNEESRVEVSRGVTPDMEPGKWIWLPSQRTLSNTFVLFRKEVALEGALLHARGWITADSRYLLTVNGQRIQWGPAPSDPRWPDVDPVDITAQLVPGKNVIGVTVLYYGFGEGTWVMGKPGLLFRLDLEFTDNRRMQLVSDDSWSVLLDRAHRPGQYKRWYLRALQEEFDARLHPQGWDRVGYAEAQDWVAPMILDCPSDKPAICGSYRDYLHDSGCNDSDETFLRARQIPLLKEVCVSAKSMVKTAAVKWHTNPLDWFEFRMPHAFSFMEEPPEVTRRFEGTWEIVSHDWRETAVALTFELDEQMVGWPRFTIEASEGTVVELICQESHDPATTTWLDTHFFSWTRFVCREGVNVFETFDFESLRWMQLHIRNADGPVAVSDVGVRRREYEWPNSPMIQCSDSDLQRLFDAGINTLRNGAQETIVDGMGRERQQYGGDISHCLQAIRYAFGDTALARRFLRTYSEGLTVDGYLMDCWPAYDRMTRLAQRQVGLTKWGPLLDHSVQFVFDCWNHYFETGDKEALREPYPRLCRIAVYFEKARDADGMLPVENLGIPVVWMDHDAYSMQRHKKCAFNLYVSAMFTHAMAPVARLFGDEAAARGYEKTGDDILRATREAFWDEAVGVFVNNLPWMAEEGSSRYCDRSLAASILFGHCPENDTDMAVRLLLECPANLGLSYPANAGWRYWALAKAGKGKAVLDELRLRWAHLPSVVLNNTLSENWEVRPDTTDQWSHMPVSPIYVLYSEIAGIKPTAPGFAACAIRPQLGDVESLALTAHTVRGPIKFQAVKHAEGHRVSVSLPEEVMLEGTDAMRVDRTGNRIHAEFVI